MRVKRKEHSGRQCMFGDIYRLRWQTVKKKKNALPPDVLETFRAWGSAGGKKRARNLTADERSAIAKKAVAAREKKKKQR